MTDRVVGTDRGIPGVEVTRAYPDFTGAAYHAYCKSLAVPNHWEYLDEEQKLAWTKAAAAVLRLAREELLPRCPICKGSLSWRS